jgi:hypothetical protein
MKKIRLSRTELANRLIAISHELNFIRGISNDNIMNHNLTNISILCDVDKRGYCDEENNRVEKQWYADVDLSDEEDKRRECAIRTNKDNMNIIKQFVNAFEEEGELEQILHYGDYEALMRGVDDIDSVLDLEDDRCIGDNWYDLFEPKKEKQKKEKPKVLIPKDSILEWVETRKFYNVIGGAKARVTEDYTTEDKSNDLCIQVEWLDEKANGQENGGYLLGMFKEEFEPEIYFSFDSSCGSIDCDKEGNVIKVNGDEQICGDRNYLFDIARVDIKEHSEFCASKNITHGECTDILSIGYWTKKGEYNEPNHIWREEIYITQNEAPTVLCKTPQTHEFVKDIIAKLKVIDVDGETMQYILKEVGMEEQMFKQFIKDKVF